MRIAQVSPLIESVPPKLYGGTERVVSFLTEELVRTGHSVTLFASGDSVTSAKLVPVCPRSLRLDPRCGDSLPYHFLMLEEVFRQAANFDVVHFHTDYLHYPLFRRHGISGVTTLHGRMDTPDLVPLYKEYGEMWLISISNSQRTPLPWLRWLGTVYHGLPEDLFKLHEEPGEYLAFLGRVAPEKGLDRAIEIAKRVGMPLRIAAKVDRADREYFLTAIKPLLNDSRIEFMDEIGDAEKDEFLGNAYALLFPVDWPEPFGLAMIESMACGTPVIAYNRGSVPEVVDEGVTGFVVNSVEEAVETLKKVPGLCRRRCRERFEERFSARRMAEDYLAAYRRLQAAEFVADAA